MSSRTLAVLVAGIFGFSAAALAADPPPSRAGASARTSSTPAARRATAPTARARGPAAKQVGATVPDITTYAKRNGGKFPVELAWQKIDGRPASFDAERSMPVWGRDFRHEAIANMGPTAQPESYVAAEIYAIIEYMKGMQVK